MGLKGRVLTKSGFENPEHQTQIEVSSLFRYVTAEGKRRIYVTKTTCTTTQNYSQSKIENDHDDFSMCFYHLLLILFSFCDLTEPQDMEAEIYPHDSQSSSTWSLVPIPKRQEKKSPPSLTIGVRRLSPCHTTQCYALLCSLRKKNSK